jgi:hypothetical protein
MSTSQIKATSPGEQAGREISDPEYSCRRVSASTNFRRTNIDRRTIAPFGQCRCRSPGNLLVDDLVEMTGLRINSKKTRLSPPESSQFRSSGASQLGCIYRDESERLLGDW